MNENKVIMAQNKGPYWIESLEKEYKNDSSQWLEYLKSDTYHGLIHLGEKLQNDGEFFKEAIRIEPNAFNYASEELKYNKKWVLEALSINVEIISLCSKELKNDPVFIAMAKVHDPKNPFKMDLPPVSIQAGLDGAFNNLKKAEVVNPLDLNTTKFLDYAKYSILSFLKRCKEEKEPLEDYGDYRDDYWNYIDLLMKKPFNNDREIVVETLKSLFEDLNWEEWFKALPLEFRSEKEIVLMALGKDPYCIEHVLDQGLLNDREVILAGINSGYYSDYCENGIVFKYASKKLRADRNLLELALPEFGAALNYASKDLQLDIDLNKKAIEISSRDTQGYMSCYSLEGMPKEIQHNKEIILHALKYRFLDCGAIPDTLLNDRDIGLAIIKAGICGGFKMLNSELRADFELAKAAVNLDGNNLQHLSKKLKSNPEIVSTALHSNFASIEHVSRDCEILSNKSEIMKILKKNHPGKGQNTSSLSCWNYSDTYSVFRFLDKKLREDKDIVLAALPMRCPVLSWTSNKLKDDREVVLAAIKHSSTRSELKHASKRLRDDNLVVRKAMVAREGNLEFASKRIRSDKNMMKRALLRHSGLKWVDASLLSNRSLILSGISYDTNKFDNGILPNYIGIPLTARSSTSNNLDGLERISDKLKADREILYNALLLNLDGFTQFFCKTFMEFGQSKYKINNPLLKDKEFILSIIKVNSGMLNVIATQEAFLDVWKDKNFLKKLSYIGSCCNYWADDKYIHRKEIFTIKNNPEMINIFNTWKSKAS